MEKKILLVMPVPFREVEGQVGFDDQTCEGLVRWAENFEKVVMACPLMPKDIAAKSENSIVKTTWQPIADLPCADRLELVQLPYAYKLLDFIRVYSATSKLLREKIQESEYLCFAIGGLVGDWGSIACLEAIKLKRSYALWADRVEYEVIYRTRHSQPWRRRIKDFFTLPIILPLMKRYQRYLISQSKVGLFQGQDCYSAYSPFCQQPYCVYDVHTKKSDQVDEPSTNLKIESLLNGGSLLICYVGRAAEMKGPLDWLQAIHQIYKAGIDFQATWVGQGPLLPQMQSLVQKLGIADRVNLVGFLHDRSKILQTIREHHIFLFCHKTPESPRCLVESLVSGCPIVGYGSSYAEGLVSQNGGGLFVPVNNWQQLADLVIKLNSDRGKLIELIREAALSGKLFDEETVFRDRSDLIKKYLSSETSKYLSNSKQALTT